MSRVADILLRLALLAGLGGALWLFCLPLAADIAVLALLVVLTAAAAKARLLLLLCSLLGSLLLLELTVRAASLDRQGVLTAYREHEMFARDTRYAPDVDQEVAMPHGDLVALDREIEGLLEQPRTVRFRTDSLGYRNDRDYAGEQLILVGDSFVVGNGNDQSSTLASLLQARHGIAAYAVAFPMNPNRLLEDVATFLSETPGSEQARIALFLFEGNDCSPVLRKVAEPSRYDLVKLSTAETVRPWLRSARFLYVTTRQAARAVHTTGREQVEVYWLGGGRVGFYGYYVDAAVAEVMPLAIEEIPEQLRARIAAVFFIPTKYRVYFDALPSRLGRSVPEPPPCLVSAQRFFSGLGVPVHDLTPALKREAGELLDRGELVYWRDDTHWNHHGAAVAAAEVASRLRQ